jgi:outer membrane protein
MKKVILGLLLVFATSAANAEVKIGYVDLQKAVQNTKAGKEAKSGLEKEFKAKEAELKKKEAALKKMTEDFEKKAALLSDDARKKQEIEIQKEMLKFRQTVAQSQQDISTKERTVTQPILEQMAKTIEAVAKRDGYTMILEKRDQNILWASETVDATSAVVTEFEKTYMADIAFPKQLPVYGAEIESILPHRYPFLLIDRVIALSGGSSEDRKNRKIVAIKNITFNEPQFTGHFPGNPVYPGVMMIETMAQASAMAAYDPSKKTEKIYIVSINNAKFRTPVIPGDCLEVHSECTKDRGSMVIFSCQAYVEKKLVAEAEIWAKIF